jgi:hypothetical protein
MEIVREELIGLLVAGPVSVTFTKADGTDRVMKCTKWMDLIPEENHPKKESTGDSTTSDNITVFDLEKGGWRSFNITKVKEYSVV